MNKPLSLIPALLISTFCLLHGEDWKTVDGKVYEKITVVRAEPDIVTILYKDGGAKIPLANLPPALQQKFQYDPKKAKIAAAQRETDEKANAAALSQEKQEVSARKQQALKAQAEEDEEARVDAVLKDKITSGERRIFGKVLQKCDGGYLVEAVSPDTVPNLISSQTGEVTSTNSDDDPTKPKLLPEGTYFLASDKSYADNDYFDLNVYPAGKFSYTSVLGAEKTVRRYAVDLDAALSLLK